MGYPFGLQQNPVWSVKYTLTRKSRPANIIFQKLWTYIYTLVKVRISPLTVLVDPPSYLIIYFSSLPSCFWILCNKGMIIFLTLHAACFSVYPKQLGVCGGGWAGVYTPPTGSSTSTHGMKLKLTAVMLLDKKS